MILLSATVNIFNIWNEGLGNLYYSAGVSSMGKSIHAFLYNGLDVSGYISIDKPPLGLWVQVLSTKIFGFNGLAILLPEAIAGIISVVLIYRIVYKQYCVLAGFVSGIVLALTPMFVAVSRNNTIDSILILLLVLSSEQAIKSVNETGFKHIILAGIFLGLGFNVKTLQAYMIVPAVYLTYLFISKNKIGKRIMYTCLSCLIMLIISFSWIVAVDLTPASDRPYVGSSQTNSELELTLGNNGIGRLFGMNTYKNNLNKNNDKNNNETQKDKQNIMPPPINNQQNSNIGNMMKKGGEGGDTSILRFFNDSMSGQISWFIIPAFLSLIIWIFNLIKKKEQLKTKENALMFYFTMCFIPMFIYFSFSSGMVHRYYLAMIAPSIAVLTGVGAAKLFNNKNKVLSVVIFVISAVAQIYIQSLYKTWLNYAVIVGIILSIIIIIIMILTTNTKVAKQIKIIEFSTLIILPFIWSLTPAIYGDNAQIPVTGPELLSNSNAFNNQEDLSELVFYLEQNQGSAKYLAMVSSAMSGGNQLILQSGKPVMVIGGFNGGDKSITLDGFKEKITNGEVKFAVFKENTKMMRNKSEDNISDWIIENCNNIYKDKSGYSVYDLTSFNGGKYENEYNK